MTILGIESSCDECALALVEDGKKILSHQIFSQIALHAPFSGVVPEIASRNHLMKILPLLEETLKDYNIQDIDAIAASVGPGLIGSLVIGTMTAKSLAYALKKPFIPGSSGSSSLYLLFRRRNSFSPYCTTMLWGTYPINKSPFSYGKRSFRDNDRRRYR